MQKRFLAILSISFLLAGCAAHPGNVGTKRPLIPTLSMDAPYVPMRTETPDVTVSPPSEGLRIDRIQMIDANVGWAQGATQDVSESSGSRDVLLRTTDGGETWRDVTPPIEFHTYKAATYLFALDADIAWATAGSPFSEDPPFAVVWRTTDGGKSWKPGNTVDISDSPITFEIVPNLQFVDSKHGWLRLHFEQRLNAYNLEYRTADGGITWEQIGTCAESDGPIPPCRVPLYTDTQTGWLRGWPEYTPNGDVIPATIWQVQKSQDGGKTWGTITLPHSQEETECYSWPARVAVGIVGIDVSCTNPDGVAERFYYLSSDQGKTWKVFPQPAGVDIVFLNVSTGWRRSKSENGYQLERTTDGGLTWQKQANGLPEGWLQFVDADTGWMGVRDEPDPFHPIGLQRTLDGGKSWHTLTPRFVPDQSEIARLEPGHPLVLKSLQMMDSSNGWASGANGYIFHTNNSGDAWQDVTPLQGRIVAEREFFAIDSQQAWTIVSFPTYTALWSTIDGGQSWQQSIALSERQTVSPESLRFLNETTGWFQVSSGGANGTQVVELMRTDDHGATWEVQSSMQYSSYARDRMAFMFLDDQNGFRIEAIANYPTLGEFLNDNLNLISKTRDAGKTWQSVSLPAMDLNLNKISLDRKAYPGGVRQVMQSGLLCQDGIALHAFSREIIGLKITCRGAYSEVIGTYGYNFVLSQYYLFTDAGANWNQWNVIADDVPREEDRNLAESEFFLPNGIGWRLNTNQLLHTTDGGKTWRPLKAVGWDEARLHFINAQEGWAIVRSGNATSLVHTTDGGKTWEEIQAVVAIE